MKPIEEAAEILRQAGLYVRLMDDGSIMGGSHRDCSGPIRIIENGFAIIPEDPLGDWFRVRTTAMAQQEGPRLELSEAVQLILDTVKPQPNIEAPPRPVPKGPICY